MSEWPKLSALLRGGIRRTTEAAPALVACIRLGSTLVSATFTWLALWYFCTLPWALYHHRVFSILALQLSSAAAMCRTAVAQEVMRTCWSWCLAFKGQQQDAATEVKGWCRQLRRAAQNALLGAAAAVAVVAALMLHGVVVLAEILTICRWFRWWALRRNPTASASEVTSAEVLLRKSQAISRELTLKLVLYFALPTTLIKLPLVTMETALYHFSHIPLVSAAISAAASMFILTACFAGPGCPIGASGRVAFGLNLAGQIAWRVVPNIWFSAAFTGYAFAVWVAVDLTSVLVFFWLARGRAGFKAYLSVWSKDKVSVTYCTLIGTCVLTFDLVALFEILQAPGSNPLSKPAFHLFFSRSIRWFMGWRVLEGLLYLAAANLVNPPALPPCPFWHDWDALWQYAEACIPGGAVHPFKLLMPNCWACSGLKQLWLEAPYNVAAVMWSSTAVALLVLLVGYLWCWYVVAPFIGRTPTAAAAAGEGQGTAAAVEEAVAAAAAAAARSNAAAQAGGSGAAGSAGCTPQQLPVEEVPAEDAPQGSGGSGWLTRDQRVGLECVLLTAITLVTIAAIYNFHLYLKLGVLGLMLVYYVLLQGQVAWASHQQQKQAGLYQLPRVQQAAVQLPSV